MSFASIVAFLAAAASVTLAFGVLRRTGRSLATICFAAGLGFLAVETSAFALARLTPEPADGAWLPTIAAVAGASIPGCWLCFSLLFSRGDGLEILRKSWLPVSVAVLLPLGLVAGFPEDCVPWLWRQGTAHSPLSWTTKALYSAELITLAAVLANLECTLKAAVGMVRVRVKFIVLGAAVVFATRIYSYSEALLFSSHNHLLEEVNAGSLLIGVCLMGVGYFRRGFSEIDLYPSKQVLQSSVTVLLVGGYLVVVGLLAQAVPYFGGAATFQTQALLVLVAITGLAVLLNSDRLRQRISLAISRHFGRPQYDFREIWSQAIRHTSSVTEPTTLCRGAGRLLSETFEILSVSIWLYESSQERASLVYSTSHQPAQTEALGPTEKALEIDAANRSRPFRLEGESAEWLARWPGIRLGEDALCVPLCAADRVLGFVLLGDRVRGVPYTPEEKDLLKCLGDQIAGGLLNLRLGAELMQAKELEAFQNMSAFFVHDLKNATASLNLMLQNFPVHFANPLFREEALRGLGQTSQRIQQLIDGLTTLQHKLVLRPTEADLNEVVMEAFAGLGQLAGVEVVQELRPVPKVRVDRAQFGSVITNLLLNAREALTHGGRISVETSEQEGRAVLSVSDTGCGMTAAFLRESLFRPFRTTKKKGLGIGMFQSKAIVEAHQGSIHVASTVGQGTTFRVILPA